MSSWLLILMTPNKSLYDVSVLTSWLDGGDDVMRRGLGDHTLHRHLLHRRVPGDNIASSSEICSWFCLCLVCENIWKSCSAIIRELEAIKPDELLFVEIKLSDLFTRCYSPLLLKAFAWKKSAFAFLWGNNALWNSKFEYYQEGVNIPSAQGHQGRGQRTASSWHHPENFLNLKLTSP